MKENCSICRNYKTIRIPQIGITFGFSGEDYNICNDCSKLSIDTIIKKIAKKYNYSYPLKLKQK